MPSKKWVWHRAPTQRGIDMDRHMDKPKKIPLSASLSQSTQTVILQLPLGEFSLSPTKDPYLGLNCRGLCDQDRTRFRDFSSISHDEIILTCVALLCPWWLRVGRR